MDSTPKWQSSSTPYPHSNLVNKPIMKVEPGCDHSNGSGSCSLRSKVDDLERQLREEKESSAFFQAESELKWVGALQEVKKYQRDCLTLQENVTRLEEDCVKFRENVKRLEEECNVLREREMQDRERIKGLLEEIKVRDEELKAKVVELKVENRDLECAKRRADEESDKWQKKYEEIHGRESRLVDEIFRLKGGKGKNPLSYTVEGCPEDMKSVPELSRKYDFVVVDSEDEGEHIDEYSFDEEDRTPIGQLVKKSKGTPEVIDGARNVEPLIPTNGTLKKKPRSSSLKKKSSKRSNLGFSLTAKTPVSSVCEGRKPRSSSLKKKNPERSNLGFSPTQRTPVSSDCEGVTETKLQSIKRKSEFPNQAYTGRITSPDQELRALRKAEKFSNNLNSNSPSFLKSVVRTNVSTCYWLALPRQFCREHLRAQDMRIVLEDEKGFEHEVSYYCERFGFCLPKGFVVANNLEVGDALVFELSGLARFKVYIIKAE